MNQMSLENTIISEWQKISSEMDAIHKEILNYPWYVILFKAEKVSLKQKELSRLNEKWHIYFDLITKHDLLPKKEMEIITINPESWN